MTYAFSSPTGTTSYGNYSGTTTVATTGTSPCGSSCCDTSGCVSTCPTTPQPGPGQWGAYCNTQCCEWQYALGYMPSGCYCQCGTCEKCGTNGYCYYDSTHCECQQYGPECKVCLPNGEWVDDPNCALQPADNNPCICPRSGVQYCQYHCSVSIDCKYYPSGPVCADFPTPEGGWVLTGKTVNGNGTCTYNYCSQGSGTIDTTNCRRLDGSRCCAGNAAAQCQCTFTATAQTSASTAGQKYCGGSWCTSLPGTKGYTPPPSSWIQVSKTSTEVCYREKLCPPQSNSTGTSNCSLVCPDGVNLETECSCISCNCNTECPVGKTCVNGQCR